MSWTFRQDKVLPYRWAQHLVQGPLRLPSTRMELDHSPFLHAILSIAAEMSDEDSQAYCDRVLPLLGSTYTDINVCEVTEVPAESLRCDWQTEGSGL